VKARERIAVLAALNLAYAIEQQPASAPAEALGEDGSVDIDSLVQRIDKALGEHGHLL
jgi:cell division protein ZapA